MRALLILGLGCVLVTGCTSPSPPKKPSPYRYTTCASLLTLGAH